MVPEKQITHFFYVRQGHRVVSPDASPVGVLIRDDIDTSIAVTVTLTSDLGWVARAMIPVNWLDGDRVHLRISSVFEGYPVTTTIYLGEVSTVIAKITQAEGNIIGGLI